MPSAVENSDNRRQRLAARRAAIGLNQDELADVIGVSRQTVGRWESGVNVLLGPDQFEAHEPRTGGEQDACYPWPKTMEALS